MIQKRNSFLCSFIAFVLLFLLIPTSYADAQITLSRGMQGSEVFKLQSDLNSIGTMLLEPTGYYGEITEKAVFEFQKEYNLLQDGIAGVQTLNMLKRTLSEDKAYATTNEIILKKDMEGEKVLSLQENLKKLGLLTVNPTGYFGASTESAVIQFQKEHGLIPDGIAGPNTYTKMELLLNKPELKKGMTSTKVSELQRDLKKLKFFNTEPTGYFGEITEAAVKSFQIKYNLNVTGTVDLLTFAKIDTLLDSSSKGIKIVVDPGHGGFDVGTTKGDILESSVVLDISRKIKTYLDQQGYDAILTRDKDTALDHLSKIEGTRVIRDLNARTNIINDSNADFFVSIHVNSLPEHPSVSGSIVFYNADIPKSKTLAQNIQKALNEVVIENFKRQSNKIKTEDFYVLKQSNIPGVLVETAFITNPNEFELLKTDSFKDKVAKAVVNGIVNTK